MSDLEVKSTLVIMILVIIVMLYIIFYLYNQLERFLEASSCSLDALWNLVKTQKEANESMWENQQDINNYQFDFNDQILEKIHMEDLKRIVAHEKNTD